MFQFLTHVELSRSMAAILEMPQYVAYQKNVVNAFIKLSAKSHSFNILCTMDGLSCPTTLRFYLIDFQLNADFPSQFCGGGVTVKSPSVTRRSVSQENALKRKKHQNPVTFFLKTIGSNNFVYSNSKQFQVFKIAKFEFKVTVHYSLWAKCTQL